MYYFIISVLILAQSSCKSKHHHDQPRFHLMEHFYKFYKGKITAEDLNRSKADSIFNYITFNDTIRKYFKNYNNYERFKKDSYVKVYKYVRDPESKMNFDQVILGSDTIIVLINDTLTNHVENENDKNGKMPKGRGNMNCIPKFEQNTKNDLFFFEEKGSLYVPLMTADHKTAKNEIVNFLTNYNFKISQDDYDVLNYIYKKEKLIEGGMDTIKNVVYLSIYKPNSDVSYLKIKEFK